MIMTFVCNTDYKTLIEKNRKAAFICYVRDWKKQDINTIDISDGIYSYTTKRGIKKSFRATDKVSPLKVQGFYFEAI